MNQIYFDNLATFDDWGIYLSSYKIDDAEPKENYIDLPSGHGSLDLTEALTGEISYGDRNFEATFFIESSKSDWSLITKKIKNFLHGKKRNILLASDPDLFLRGRCRTDFEDDGVMGTLTIIARCEPWFYKREVTRHEFNFKDKTKIETSVYNSRRAVIPTFETDDELKVTFKGQSRLMTAGSHQFTGIYFEEGFNNLTLEAKEGATVTIEYQEGVL